MPSGADLDAWTKEHDALVQWRAGKLRDDGLRPRIEQSFTINGRTATIKGKADIVYEDKGVTWIEECKTGKHRDSDLVQALVYVWLAEIGGQRESQARVIYKDGSVDVDRSRLPEIRAAALRLVSLTTSEQPPARVPSQQECRSCNISPFYCDERVGSLNEIFVTDEF